MKLKVQGTEVSLEFRAGTFKCLLNAKGIPQEEPQCLWLLKLLRPSSLKAIVLN